MPTGLTIRPLDGPSTCLVVDDHGHFADPGDVAVTAELDSGAWYALPGLADCHAHLSGGEVGSRVPLDELDAFVARSCWAQLQGGVFLVADKGTHDAATLRILDTPPTERPDLHMAGRVIAGTGGYYPDFGREVGPADLAAAVAESAAPRGASWVKLIGDWPRKGVGAVASFEEDALAQAAKVAHDAGCRIAIHACAPRTSTMAVAAGFDSIEHGLFLTAADVEALGRRGGAWVPTIDAMEGIRDMLGESSSGGRLFAEGLGNMRELLPAAPSLGVAVLAGTDLHLAHGEVAQEALKLAEYGLGADAVVHAMTTAAYEYLGQRRGFESGMPADVVFFDRDPREDLSVLQHPVFALRHGREVVRR
jgi:imidazolonepropionase-like amidohydrolase